MTDGHMSLGVRVCHLFYIRETAYKGNNAATGLYNKMSAYKVLFIYLKNRIHSNISVYKQFM